MIFGLVGQITAQKVTTVAGGFVGDGRPAKNATFQQPAFVAQDRAGNLYVSDFTQHRVRRIDHVTSTISTYAGTGLAGYTGDGGPATQATLRNPSGLVFDSQGNLFVADQWNYVVRKVDASGTITTFAGTGVYGYSGDGGPATQAQLGLPSGLAFDDLGTLHISNLGNCVVRSVDSAGTIHTYAGNGLCGFSGDGGPANQAQLHDPQGLALDSNRNLYIADHANHLVRIVTPSHIIHTFAGIGSNGYSGDGGPATDARVGEPRGLTIHEGTLYISNGGQSRIRYVDLRTGIINTFAGFGFGYDGDNNPLASSQFAGPGGLLFNPQGNLIVVDRLNTRLRAATDGVMKTIGGGFIGDRGLAKSAALVLPSNLAFDKAGNYYIADAVGNRIRKVDTKGRITTVAGTGVSGYTGDGGPATAATLSLPEGVAVDGAGNIFIADLANFAIRKVDRSGTITTFAKDSHFFVLQSLATDKSGNVYSTDPGTCVVRKITPDGTVSVVAGIEDVCGYNGDGIQATSAQLYENTGVAVDAGGNLYIADSLNGRIRKVDPIGIITTIAGDGNCGFSGDGGPAVNAEFCLPYNVAVGAAGSVYVADLYNYRVRKISGGIINTVAGSGVPGYNGDGLPALSTNLDSPVAVAVNPRNKAAYILDDQQSRVRVIH
jgi:sugar lactone lactonase YvrE